MDGTLLDLRFDNYFWLDLVPERYAAKHGLTLDEAREVLRPMFADRQGTLDWYCTDFWTRALSLDIAGMKHEVREHVRFLPGAEDFLRALREKSVRIALVTNAHRDSLESEGDADRLAELFRRGVQLAQLRRAEGTSVVLAAARSGVGIRSAADVICR